MTYKNFCIAAVALFFTASCRNDDKSTNSSSVEGQWKITKTEIVYSSGITQVNTINSADCEGQTNMNFANGNATTTWYGMVKGSCGITQTTTGSYQKDSKKLFLNDGSKTVSYDIIKLTHNDFIFQGELGIDKEGDGKNDAIRVTLKR